MSKFKEEIVWAYGKNYKTVQTKSGSDCSNCDANKSNFTCAPFTDELQERSCNGIHFKEVQEVNQPISLNFNLELDFSSSILPTQFKVKSLKLSSLDDALAKGTESYTISTQSLNQEQIQAVAEGLKQEFILRNTKEVK